MHVQRDREWLARIAGYSAVKWPIAVLLGVLGCTTSELTEAGQHVTYANAALDVSGCEELGAVESGGTQPGDHASRTVAIHELRNAAATKGATHVYVDEEASPKLDRGTAYRCP